MRRPRLTGPEGSVRCRGRRAAPGWGTALIAVLVAFAGVAGWSGPAGAHAGLLGSSPAPGATVGGTIEAYDVWFDQSIVELYSMGLSTEEGTELPGEWNQPAPNLIRFTPDAAPTEAGNYIVSYEMLAEDGDTTRSAFVFAYEPGAPPPEPAPADEIMAGATSRAWILGGVVVVGAALVGGTILIRRRRGAGPEPGG